jgi:hypothetical protein
MEDMKIILTTQLSSCKKMEKCKTEEFEWEIVASTRDYQHLLYRNFFLSIARQ